MKRGFTPFRTLSHVGAALLVASCATGPTKDRIVEVATPVAVQPIKPDQIPALPAPLPKRPANVSSALDLALGKWCEAVAYILKTDPLLRVSAGLPPRDLPPFPECETH